MKPRANMTSLGVGVLTSVLVIAAGCTSGDEPGATTSAVDTTVASVARTVDSSAAEEVHPPTFRLIDVRSVGGEVSGLLQIATTRGLALDLFADDFGVDFESEVIVALSIVGNSCPPDISNVRLVDGEWLVGVRNGTATDGVCLDSAESRRHIVALARTAIVGDTLSVSAPTQPYGLRESRLTVRLNDGQPLSTSAWFDGALGPGCANGPEIGIMGMLAANAALAGLIRVDSFPGAVSFSIDGADEGKHGTPIALFPPSDGFAAGSGTIEILSEQGELLGSRTYEITDDAVGSARLSCGE